MSERISKIDIIACPSKFEELKEGLSKIGVEGMTISNVLGCGTQKGYKKYYRSTSVDVNLQPKIKVEIVVCDVPVELVVETAKKILRTGNYGDGKIFIYDVLNVIRIRNGTEGRDALNNEE